jgi:energy-coupling factor transport system ATP-binding protein
VAAELRAELEQISPSLLAVNSPLDAGSKPELTAKNITVRYDDLVAVAKVNTELSPGQIVALMGRNGSGKSSLLWALQGSGRRESGSVTVQSNDPGSLSPGQARALVGLVPQTPTDLLYLATVKAECSQADQDAQQTDGTCEQLLHRIVEGIDPQAHPRDLSEGQKLALVLAIQLCAKPRVLLLDEPTRGLDYRAKEHLTKLLQELAAQGHAILVCTHDVEFVASTADRVLVMAAGEIVADGPTADVVVASPAFAPQVAKILNPQPWLTVEAVADALRGKL